MLAVDTNVIVRYLTNDDPHQSSRARKLVEESQVWVATTVLLETEWVLRSRYTLQKPEIMATISALLDATELRFEDEAAIEEALFIWKDTSADFADCLIGARNRRLGCRATATFDAKAVELPGFVAV